MCGISGIVKLSSNYTDNLSSSIKEMAAVQIHRGPDFFDTYVNENVAFGHNRLSIIDLSSLGNQPMSIQNLTIVFNGEIYNHLELRVELKQIGYQFKSTSDTETILCGFLEWGEKIFEKMNGIFALAIHNRNSNEVLLARDRFGVKPLYFYTDADKFYFSSELKCILARGVSRKVNYKALMEFVYYGYALKEKTLFENIIKILPGQYMKISDSKKIETQTFWSHDNLLNESVYISEDEAVRNVDSLLDHAVQRQLLSDVPVGIFLSGGIDSSAITYYASKHFTGRIKTYSAAFDFSSVSELDAARKVAKINNTEHHEFFIKGNDISDLVYKLIHHHDEPFSDAANIPLYLMTKEVKPECKVILQGDGGDEMFGGYARYHLLSRFNYYKFFSKAGKSLSKYFPLNAKLKNQIERFYPIFNAKNEGEMYGRLLTIETPENSPTKIFAEKTKIKVEEHNPFYFYEELSARFADIKSKAQKMLWIDTLIILPDQFLEKVDKSTMANSVEVRVPFLDNELAEYAMKLPSDLKLKNGIQKYILKKALAGKVPNEILEAKKQGFGVPYQNWLNGPLRELKYDVIRNCPDMYRSLFDWNYIDKIIKDHENNRGNHGFLIWKIVNLLIWLKEYKAQFDD